MQTYDPLSLTIELCKRRSVTPKDEGCEEVIASLLERQGFNIEYFEKDGTKNIYATLKNGAGPSLMFLGHTDVVPEGDLLKWDCDPYACVIKDYDGRPHLVARGSADMKGGDACMTLALCDFVKEHKDFKGSLSLLLTSNEEGDAKGGVPYVAQILKERNDIPDMCIVGEPSSSQVLGDTIKVGRRGSMTAHITVHGVQGHVAYPELVKNPVSLANPLIEKLLEPLDEGNALFPPSSFQITNIKAGTGAENVVPGSLYFMCNWRFNNMQSPQSIQNTVSSYRKSLNLECDVEYVVNGLPFACDADSTLTQCVEASIQEITGLKATLSSAGGTSDGRFIAPLGTSVLEFGVCNGTIHKDNERVATEDLYTLKQIYQRCLEKLFL